MPSAWLLPDPRYASWCAARIGCSCLAQARLAVVSSGALALSWMFGGSVHSLEIHDLAEKMCSVSVLSPQIQHAFARMCSALVCYPEKRTSES